MNRPIKWYRLYRGKVWHLMHSDAALCGDLWHPDAERTHGQPPTNARICMDCHAQATELRIAAEQARQGDPRSVARDLEMYEAIVERLQRGLDIEPQPDLEPAPEHPSETHEGLADASEAPTGAEAS